MMVASETEKQHDKDVSRFFWQKMDTKKVCQKYNSTREKISQEKQEMAADPPSTVHELL